MISTSNVTLRVGKKALFEDVSIKFTEGNCYGMIGANGAGKSTFLKILSGQLEPTNGEVVISQGQRLSFLQQDHFKYDAFPVLDTVIMGNARLYEIMKEKDAIYMKEDFSEEDGIKAAELEGEFATMNGWEAESDAASLLNGLGIDTELHGRQMSELNGSQKVKVLLAQALFGNPDILLLDEPTNHLDLDAIAWLEEFLINFENTVIVVSHDRYFLNKVCTHIADIDYGKIQLYAGNYDFWYESSQLMIRQMKEANKKKEEKIKELQEFIQRFSANASKSKQATSRKRALEKIELDEIKPSSRKYPYIDFRPDREIGNEVLTVENLSKTIDGVKVLDNISFILGRQDKVALVGPNEQAKTVLFKILSGEMEPDEGSYKWGLTTSQAYFPKDNSAEFDNDDIIVDWLTQYSPVKDVTYVRGFLGRMLFAGEDGVKKVRVLSGGEKVRCMFSKMMISGANVLMFDEPTDHLDMESITALNNGLIKFPGVILFSSRDHQIVETTANRIMEIVNGKLIDKITTYDEYLASDEMARKRQVFTVTESQQEDN
ncbi:ABC-F family ATP-binding cassette domain-containing protein [Otoolea muris]|uniref:ABC-F family ATP-binding cassette domain-containing protein n=1 Tax=Otoolea muris TaxID=2941515 RepID=UPI00203F93B2|nr:ATP-binding cassette domain-containing protein [Otoolea muris]